MLRLFAAIALPGSVVERLQTLCAGVPGAKWQSAEQMHLTLRFIGEVEERTAEDIDAALSTVEFDPFEVTIAGVGHFGKLAAARNLWAGVEDPGPLRRLHERIDTGLVHNGFPPEERKFTPHVTLARLKRANRSRLAEYIRDHQGLCLPDIGVEAFHLYSSRLSHKGAQYRIEASYPAR